MKPRTIGEIGKYAEERNSAKVRSERKGKRRKKYRKMH